MFGSLVDSRGKGQAKELQVDTIDVLGECDPEVGPAFPRGLARLMPPQIYPIQKQTLPVDYLRDHAHLRARTDTSAAILRLRDSLAKAFHRFYEACTSTIHTFASC